MTLFLQFPELNVTDGPNATNISEPAVSSNVSNGLSFPGKEVFFTWEVPGKVVGYNASFQTVTNVTGLPQVDTLSLTSNTD